jgi:DNA polymerase (family 10)
MKQVMDQFAVAAALQEIAALLELKGGKDRFKARAYQRGSRVIAGLTEDLETLVKQDRLTSIRGIGSGLASQIRELHLTGSSSVLSKLKTEFPPGTLELSNIPGLSIPKIKNLHEALGITSTAELKAAAEAGKIKKVKGFGARSEEKLLESLVSPLPQEDRRLHIHHAHRIGDQLVQFLQTGPGIVRVELAGSIRRAKETVGVIRLVASASNPASLLQHFLQFPLIVGVTSQDKDSCLVVLSEGAIVALTVVKAFEFVPLLWRETGSAAHFAKLQALVSKQKSKLDLNDRSAFVSLAAKGKSRGADLSEEGFYKGLRMQFVAPELREDSGEVEAALEGTLPQDLISVPDIKGMVHCHTTYSDGKNSIREMAQAAEAMGMKYITITDHSPTAFYAGGVTTDRLKRQWEEIDEVQQTVKVKILKGTESDIVADGSLDYPDRILETFDVIVASIHSRYKMDAEKMTRRLISAMRQPVFKIWGHALGRLIQKRPPFACDIEKVLDAIAESRAAIEINGDPFRLDMEPRFVREARKRHIKFVISVDAHSTGALNNLKYGVGVARRGWVRKGEVLNTLGSKAFANAVRPAG